MNGTLEQPHPWKPGGVLAGVRLGPRPIAILAHNAGFRDDNVFMAVAICGAESSRFTRARNDNKTVITSLDAGQLVRNIETGELVTILDPARGKIRLSDGETVTVPLTTTWVTSRDVGLWQRNIPANQIGTAAEEKLYDPAANAAAAFKLWADRGWQPWVAYTSNAFLLDTYIQWAILGTANRWAEIAVNEARNVGHKPDTRVPWVTIPNLRQLYPGIDLG